MRAGFNIYRQLGKYLKTMDEEASSRGDGPEDKSIDSDFRSGVYLGVGTSNIMLSLMPARVVSLMEVFGYKGDRDFGLSLLARAGGWTEDSLTPSISIGEFFLISVGFWTKYWSLRARGNSASNM